MLTTTAFACFVTIVSDGNSSPTSPTSPNPTFCLVGGIPNGSGFYCCEMVLLALQVVIFLMDLGNLGGRNWGIRNSNLHEFFEPNKIPYANTEFSIADSPYKNIYFLFFGFPVTS